MNDDQDALPPDAKSMPNENSRLSMEGTPLIWRGVLAVMAEAAIPARITAPLMNHIADQLKAAGFDV